jgi:hypothetical protein
MKKILFLIIISFAINATELGMVKIITMDDDTQIYLDVNTIDNNGTYIQVWGQLIYREPKDGSQSIRFKTEIDCQNKSDRIIFLEGFSEKADRTFASFVEEPKHNKTQPGTNGRMIIDYVCN